MDEDLSQDEQFLNNLQKIIEENLSNENFSVNELAQKIGCSRSVLHRKLIKITGHSASEIIMATRLERARDMLEKDVASVAEIAYNVGFKSPSYFNKVYKMRFEISPGETRRKFLNTHQPSQIIPKKISVNKRKISVIAFVIVAVAGIIIMIESFNYSEKSVAVLPVLNLTGLPENEIFVSGLHDALIGELGNLNSLRVISRTSTLRYKDSNMLMKEIAEELDVSHLVESSLIKVDDSIKFMAQLIDVFPKEKHLFTANYNDKLENILKVQSSFVKDIAKTIHIKLTEKEKTQLEERRKVNPGVYKSYVRGMYHLNKGTAQNFDKGIKYLLEAIEIDPADPLAYAGLAMGYATMGHGVYQAKEAFYRGIAAAKMAIKIDPTADEAHTALAILNLYQSWNWEEAKIAFENALKQNPNNEHAHAHFAWYWILFNDTEKAVHHGGKATEINPFSAAYSAWQSLLFYNHGKHEKAEYWAHKALELQDNIPYANYALAYINLDRKNYDEALTYCEKLPRNNYFDVLRGDIYVRTDQRSKALEIWKSLIEKEKAGSVDYFCMGMMAASLEFNDLAFMYFDKAFIARQYPLPYVNHYHSTLQLRNDSRYHKLLEKLNVPLVSGFPTE